MIVTTPAPLITIDEMILEYVNSLRSNLAETSAMLMNSRPEEKTLERLAEVRARNTELESTNRDLRDLIDQQRVIVSQQDGELRALREQNATLLNERNKAREFDPPMPHLKPKGMDAITEGREALKKYKAETMQPARGE